MHPFQTSSFRVKVIYINLLWKKFEMQEIIKAITKELEPGIKRSLIYLPTFAFLHNYCLQNQSRVCKEVRITYRCHILDFSQLFIMLGWLLQCHYKN